VPLERLALSPQCGFASSIIGNDLSIEDERRKLERVYETARRIWRWLPPPVRFWHFGEEPIHAENVRHVTSRGCARLRDIMKTWNTPTVIGLPMTTAQWLLESGARFDAPTIELLRGIALRRHRRPLTERKCG